MVRIITKSNSKSKIFDAALTLFVKKGINATTTREIAKKAGIAEGTIYRHFKSKEELSLELFRDRMDIFRKELNSKADYYSDPQKKLEALIDSFFSFAHKDLKACFYIVIGHYTELNILKKEKFQYKDIFAEVIKQGVKKKVFRKIDNNLGAALIIGMINRAILSYNNGLIELDYNKITSETYKAALNILERKAVI
jgi:AcrR family transcriptional regulator